MPYNSVADGFHTQKYFVAVYLREKCIFTQKTAVLRFSPLGGIGATYDVLVRLIGKRVVDFILVLIERFC